jgi:hypothetical protein
MRNREKKPDLGIEAKGRAAAMRGRRKGGDFLKAKRVHTYRGGLGGGKEGIFLRSDAAARGEEDDYCLDSLSLFLRLTTAASTTGREAAF